MLTLLALYGGLFLTALVAATLLPAQSELLLGTLLVQSGEPAWALITVATLGNSAGSAVNWWLGRYLTRFQDRRWFPFSPKSLRKAEGWYHHYGRWTLLCSWMPVIGDPLWPVPCASPCPPSCFWWCWPNWAAIWRWPVWPWRSGDR